MTSTSAKTPTGPAESAGSAGSANAGGAPPIGPLGMLRWGWRQLISMRTALILLFLLAVGAVPGSLIPQRNIDPIRVNQIERESPTLAAWYDRLGLFEVYGSFWYGAIYLLLMISLLGCIIPRMAQHLRVLRARPPKAPRFLRRMPEHRQWRTDAAPAEVVEGARGLLKRYRLVLDEGSEGEPTSLAAERGHLREWGNLLFHVALTVVLVGIGVGGMFGFSGNSIVVVGNGFANTVTQYDNYTSGRFFSPSQLTPFALTVDDFHASFQLTGEMRGSAREFDATVSYTPEPGAPERTASLRLNHPLAIGNSQVHLLQHGYAPEFTVRDSSGDVAYSGPSVFLPQDGNLTSKGVVKVPDAARADLGFEGFFLPTATVGEKTGPVSVFPDALSPEVFLTAYHGDLGMDDGQPQSVYRLEKGELDQFTDKDGGPLSFRLKPGETFELPDGAGSITFDGYKRWVGLQISSDPGTPVVLVGAVLTLGGLLLSLVVRRRRVWIRVRPDGPRTQIELAGLDRNEGGDLDEEIEELARRLRDLAPPVSDDDATGQGEKAGESAQDSENGENGENADRADRGPAAKEVEA